MKIEKELRIIRIKKLYDTLGTLESVAKSENLSRERIRQLLVQGATLGLYEHVTGRERLNRNLASYISKPQLEKLIINCYTVEKISKKINVSENQIYKLLKMYEIDRKGLRIVGRKNKCIKQYKALVASLGYHPTTSIVQSTDNGINLYAKILRLWGNFNNFRKDLNIAKPPSKRKGK